jgi:DNA-binding winged helix-turn-helix (wHTH) protein
MDASIDTSPVVRINPGCFSRAGVENEAGEIEVRLSRYGNWMVHVRRAGETQWRIACNGDMETGVLATAPEGEEICFGMLRVLRGPRRVLVEGVEVDLSTKEFELLVFLLADPYRVFTKEVLMKAVWGYYVGRGTKTLDHHARRLRRKLDCAGAPGLIVNQWGIGYRLADGIPVDPGDAPSGDRTGADLAAAG